MVFSKNPNRITCRSSNLPVQPRIRTGFKYCWKPKTIMEQNWKLNVWSNHIENIKNGLINFQIYMYILFLFLVFEKFNVYMKLFLKKLFKRVIRTRKYPKRFRTKIYKYPNGTEIFNHKKKRKLTRPETSPNMYPNVHH